MGWWADHVPSGGIAGYNEAEDRFYGLPGDPSSGGVLQQQAPAPRGTMPTGDAPQKYGGPAMSFEDAQRLWQERINDPNRAYPTGEAQANESGQAANYPGGDQDYQAIFRQIMGGGMATPDALIAKERELAAQGIIVQRNAAGVAGKVKLPSGEIVDVIQSAGTGGGVAPWTWQQGPGGPTGEGGKPLPGNRFYGQPGGAQGSPLGGIGGGVDYGSRIDALDQTPGYQFRFKEGMDAIERSAAAKGTLLTGGVMKELASFGQGLASTEYDNEFNRQMGLAGLGFNAASNAGNWGTSYGNQLTNLTTGAGNAQAAGTANSGQAWGNYLGNLGNTALQGAAYYGARQPAGNQWQYPSNPWE